MSRSYRDRKVYIGNLNEDTSKTEVETIFLKYGPLKSTWIARRPPGFAFVEYEDSRDAEDAGWYRNGPCYNDFSCDFDFFRSLNSLNRPLVRALDGTKICGSRVRVEISHGKPRRESSRRESRRDGRRGSYRESR